MAQAAGDVGPHLAFGGEEDKGAAVLDRDPARQQAGLGERLDDSVLVVCDMVLKPGQ